MCGIVGYVGGRPCRELLLEGLEKLEYRGYDSAGLSILEDGRIDSVRAVGNHACGFSAAIWVIGASISPSCVRYSSRPVPRRARRALSNTAKVSHAWKTSCAISAGSGVDSHGKGRFSSGLNEYDARSPRFLYARWVASASALVISARSSSPRSIRSAVSFTSTCVVVPPIPE